MDKVTSETLSTLLNQKDLHQIPPDVLKKIESHYEAATKNIQKRDREITRLTDKLKEVTDNPEKTLEKMFPKAAAAISSLNLDSSLTEILKRYYDKVGDFLRLEAECRRLRTGECGGEDQKVLEMKQKLQKDYNDLKEEYDEYRTKSTNDYNLLKKLCDTKQGELDLISSRLKSRIKSIKEEFDSQIDLLKSNIQALESLNNVLNKRLKSSDLECENKKTALNELQRELDQNMVMPDVVKNKNQVTSDHIRTNNQDNNKLSSIAVRNCESPDDFKRFDKHITHLERDTLKRCKEATSSSAEKISPQNKRIRVFGQQNNTNDGTDHETGIDKSISLERSDVDVILDENKETLEKFKQLLSGTETSTSYTASPGESSRHSSRQSSGLQTKMQARALESQLTSAEKSETYNVGSDVVGCDIDSLEGSYNIQIREGLTMAQTQRHAYEDYKEFSKNSPNVSTPIATDVGRVVVHPGHRALGRPRGRGNVRSRNVK